MLLTQRFLVQGKVQGVFYRKSTQTKAQQLGITGWIKNCTDGSVEVQASGTSEQLQAFEVWLWQGPSRAKVDTVTTLSVDLQFYDSFIIVR